MTSTRRASTMKIYEDPYDHHDLAAAPAADLASYDLIGDASMYQNIAFDPPNGYTRGSSPHKSSDHPSSSPPPHALQDANLNTLKFPPPPKPQFAGSPKKKAPPSKPVQNPFNSSYSDMFPPPSLIDQENLSFSSDFNPRGSTDKPVEKKSGNKRSFADAPSSSAARNTKKQKVVHLQEEDGPYEIPDPEDMPEVSDPGTKPEYSYAIMIGMALLRAPNRRLTLSQIYKWISDSFSFYSPSDSGWQNSIRHNLSLNKNFIKQDRPKEDPGKGHYWTIQPGQEHVFLKEKQQRRPSTIAMSAPVPNTSVIRPSTANSTTAPSSQPKKHVDSSKFPVETELSSDATIPCSDPAIHDGQDLDASMPPPSRNTLRSSPPPQTDIRSSPPAPPSRYSVRGDTPPRFPPAPRHSRSGGRKRKFAGLGDSGYYSSIESSATKANLPPPVFTSEADFMDKPAFKPGRAEHEIKRIRSSSNAPESPLKTGLHKKSHSTSNIRSSSPFHPFNGAPLTPPIKFKQPARPPPSASPNANLRNHRNHIASLLATPDNSRFAFGEELTFTPAFDLPEYTESENFSVYTNELAFNQDFDVFDGLYDTSLIARGSPEKRSAKRPRLERATTSTSALADITSSKANMLPMSSPTKAFLDFDDIKSPAIHTPGFMKSKPRLLPASKLPTSNPFAPSDPRVLMPPPSIRQQPDENVALFADFNSDGSEEGFDITQGFQKIGAQPISVAANGSPRKVARPALARSTTTRF